MVYNGMHPKGSGFEITKATLQAGDRVVGTVRNKPSALYAGGRSAECSTIYIEVQNEKARY